MLRSKTMATPETVAADAIGGPNPIIGLRRKDVADSVRSVVTEAVRNPQRTAASLGRLARTAADVVRGRSILAPGAKDRRFADPAWSDNALYRKVVQLYLAADAE